MSAIDQGRYTVAAGAVGLAQACLDASVKLRPRAPDVRRGDRPPPARQADDRDHGPRDRDRAAPGLAGRAGSRTRACATPARRASRSGTPPTTPSRPRSTRSRSTAPTATATSSRSSATCATQRPRSSTRGRASSTRSSRPTTPSATARTGRSAASPGRPRAGSAAPFPDERTVAGRSDPGGRARRGPGRRGKRCGRGATARLAGERARDAGGAGRGVRRGRWAASRRARRGVARARRSIRRQVRQLRLACACSSRPRRTWP